MSIANRLFLLIAVYCFQYYFALFFGKTMIFISLITKFSFVILFFCFRIRHISISYTVCSICFLLFCCHCPLGSLSADIYVQSSFLIIRIYRRTASTLLFFFGLVGSSGFEPPTLRLSGARSNHLSYEPVYFTPSLFFFRKFWWR